MTTDIPPSADEDEPTPHVVMRWVLNADSEFELVQIEVGGLTEGEAYRVAAEVADFTALGRHAKEYTAEVVLEAPTVDAGTIDEDVDAMPNGTIARLPNGQTFAYLNNGKVYEV